MRLCKNRAQLLVRLSDPGPCPPGIMTPQDSLLPRPSISAPDTSHHSLLLPDQEQVPQLSPSDPPPCGGHTGRMALSLRFLPSQTPGRPRNRVTESWPDSLFGPPPLPHLWQGLWTAICSSLRNSSSSLTSGSWLAKPEWKISGANGVAMQKPEPRTQLWSGFAALARPGQALLPHILPQAERWPPHPHPAGLSETLANTPFRRHSSHPSLGRRMWDTADPRGKRGGSAPGRLLQS